MPTLRLQPSRFARQLAVAILIIAGLAGWLWVVSLTVLLVWASAVDPQPHIVWLLDWHVYAAGGRDLVARDLYEIPLTFPGSPLPVDQYNLPPFSAVWTLPLLPLPDEAAGIAWIALGAICWLSGWWVALRLLGVRYAWAWAGIALAAYSQIYWFGANVMLGNINHLVLGLLVGFAIAFVRGNDKVAGIALGLAIATKAWPVVLLVPILRDRRWSCARWTTVTAVIASLAPMIWLGFDAIGPMIRSLQATVPIEPNVPVLWTTAFREMWDWWPSWGAVAVAAALLAIPAAGIAGIGLAMLAGISAIPNIWDHYLPTAMLAAALVLTHVKLPAAARWRSAARSRHALGSPTD